MEPHLGEEILWGIVVMVTRQCVEFAVEAGVSMLAGNRSEQKPKAVKRKPRVLRPYKTMPSVDFLCGSYFMK